MNKALLNKERIYSCLLEFPGNKATSIAKDLGFSRVTVYSHLQSLVKEDRVRIEGKSSATRYFPRSKVLQGNHLALEIQKLLSEKYDEEVSEESILSLFHKYMLFIDEKGILHHGIEGFILWFWNYTNKKEGGKMSKGEQNTPGKSGNTPEESMSSSLAEKAMEYFDLIGSTEFLRGKNGFFDVTISAKEILHGEMKIGFDKFLITSISVLPHGFGSTRTALLLRYGKKNGNRELLRDAIQTSLTPLRQYCVDKNIDSVIFTPPTEGRNIQFRDVLEKELKLQIPKIKVEKLPLAGRILEPQKNIKDRTRRIANALESMIVDIPENLQNLEHILVLDDSFTTGATPNAICLKLRNAGYIRKITVITICGSFDYNLAITEEEV